MRIRLHSAIPADVVTVWDQVRDPTMMVRVAAPLVAFRSEVELPERWAQGEYPVRLLAGGLVPLGTQMIRIELPDRPGPVRVLRDNGYGVSGLVGRIRVWDHLLEIRPDEGDPTRTHQRDTVVVEAGWLTLPVWLMVGSMFLWRQAHWRWITRRAAPTPREQPERRIRA